jgi:hypothetical protein
MRDPRSLSREERDDLGESLEDPTRFARKWLQADTWGVQEGILQSIANGSKTAVKACHSSGKTFIAAAAVLWFLARYKEAIVVTTAPTHNQVEKLLWGEIHSARERSRYPFPKPNLVELKFGPKRYAIGFTTSVTKSDEGVKFQGFHADNILIILDEAPGVDPKIWEAIEGARAGGNVSILALGNPTIASGPFHEAFHAGRDTWNLFTISAFDTPNFDGISLTYLDEDGKRATLGRGRRDLRTLSEEELDTNVRPYLTTRRWVKEKFSEWGPGHPLWESRVCGNFPRQAEDALLSLAWLEKAKLSERRGEGKVSAGLDVAGPGEDETTLTIRRGLQILLMKSWPDADPRGQVVAELLPYKYELEAVNVDSAGIGWGLYLHLKDLRFPAVPINVGESPRDGEKFANLKAELYWGLRLRLQAGDMSGLTDEKAIGQLAGIRWKLNPRGQTQIESKDDARKRGVRSPDRAESVMLAFAERKLTYGLLDWAKKAEKEFMSKRNQQSTPKAANEPVNAPLNDPEEETPTEEESAGDPLEDAIPAEDVEVVPALANGHSAKAVPTEEIVKIDIPDNVERCESCGSVLIQRVANGKRCGNCGTQWNQARLGVGAPGVVRK